MTTKPIPTDFSVDAGRLKPARWLASPNYNARPENTTIDLLVLHNISLPPEQFGDGFIGDFFCNRLDTARHPYFETVRSHKVSAHLLITRRGDIVQFVAFEDRAWHAGVSAYQGRKDCNNFSIGIELEGCDNLSYAPVQYAVLAAATRVLMRAYPGIDSERIVGHSDIAPERKTDPGPRFDWERFHRQLSRIHRSLK